MNNLRRRPLKKSPEEGRRGNCEPRTIWAVASSVPRRLVVPVIPFRPPGLRNE